MSAIVAGAIDCDVHVEPASMEPLRRYLSGYWLEYLRGAGIKTFSSRTLYPPRVPLSARAEARAHEDFPPHDYEALNAQLLEPYGPRVAVLNCLSIFLAGRNPYYQAAMATAVNEWVRDEFLDRDVRLRSSIVVPTLDPEAAAQEIDRLADDPRFVQVLLPIRSETPWGNKRWRLLHDAAARAGRPVAFHAWGEVGSSPTTMGYSHTYYEDYVSISQITAPTQLLSLITEGLFERHRSLMVSIVECGFNWLPSLLWQFDKEWKSLWREVPWVRQRPSDYVREHFRFTIAPSHLESASDTEVAQLTRHFPASEVLCYASDFPHDHGDDGTDRLLASLDEAGLEAVLRGNAAALYGLGVPLSPAP